MSRDFYRFKKTRIETLSALEGSNSWYAITDARNEPVYACHVIGSCLGGTSTFHASREDETVLFRLESKRKILNLTYYVGEGSDGPRIATIELFKTRGLKVCGPDGGEQYRIVDPQGKLDKLMQDVLEGACSEYAIVSGGERVGEFGRRERTDESVPARRGLVGKLMGGLAKLFSRDWCVELTREGKGIDDHRPLLAGLILLLEQTIPHDQAT